ncbi:MAG: hypothetical protein Q7S16_02060 [bacterium]|nr:hypothetical protein [bacterium]
MQKDHLLKNFIDFIMSRSTLENPFAPEKLRSTDDPALVGKILGAEAEAAMRSASAKATAENKRESDLELTDTERAKIAEEKEARERAKKEFVLPLEDKEVPAEYQESLQHWRELAKELDYDGPVVFRVKAGFTLKDALKTGYCSKIFEELYLDIHGDKPTEDSLVFWIPRFILNGIDKTVTDQRILLVNLRNRFNLPNHHCSSFGDASLLTALILDHFKRTGEEVPSRSDGSVLTEAFMKGMRVILGWTSDGKFFCDRTSDIRGHTSVFPLGVEKKMRS